MSRPTSYLLSLAWVKRGVAKSEPDKVQLDKEELKKLIDDAQDRLDEIEDSDGTQEENMEEGEGGEEGETPADNSPKKEKKKKKKNKAAADDEDEIVNKYGLDDYDDDDEEADGSRWSGMGNMANFACDEDDPYITIKNDDDSDNEDTEIKATDNLLVCGRSEGEVCVMEVYVYNEAHSQLFFHHEYILDSCPLAIEWLNFDGYENTPGNYVALGTLEPVIQIWDLDVMESMSPMLTLGSRPKKSKKKKAKQKAEVMGHKAAVLDLSWNHNARHVLASASADTTVALWDLTEGKVGTTFTQHTKEVQCCKWHPQEQQTLLTGSMDNTVKVVDCHNANDLHKSWRVQGEVEKAVWNHHNPLQFLTCTDQGHVYCMDVRMDSPVFTLAAHKQSVEGLSLSSQIPGVMVTTSNDKTMKVWDLQAAQPSLVLSRNMRMNKLFCVECCPEAPFVFAVGGESGQPKVWDIRESKKVRHQFLNRMPTNLAAECEGDDQDVIDNNNDNDDDEEEDVDEDDAASAMEGLEMNDDDDEEEKSSVAMAAPTPAKKKKKKKKKAKKTE